MDAPIFAPALPFKTEIPGGFGVGKKVRVQGRIPFGATYFEINLQCGPNSFHDDILLRFNPRFNERIVARTSKINCNWLGEDTHGQFPFIRGQPFTVMINSEAQRFSITIDGRQYTSYSYKRSPDWITHFTINGDISISLIQFGVHRESGISPASTTTAPYKNTANERATAPTVNVNHNSEMPVKPSRSSLNISVQPFPGNHKSSVATTNAPTNSNYSNITTEPAVNVPARRYSPAYSGDTGSKTTVVPTNEDFSSNSRDSSERDIYASKNQHSNTTPTVPRHEYHNSNQLTLHYQTSDGTETATESSHQTNYAPSAQPVSRQIHVPSTSRTTTIASATLDDPNLSKIGMPESLATTGKPTVVNLDCAGSTSYSINTPFEIPADIAKQIQRMQKRERKRLRRLQAKDPARTEVVAPETLNKENQQNDDCILLDSPKESLEVLWDSSIKTEEGNHDPSEDISFVTSTADSSSSSNNKASLKRPRERSFSIEGDPDLDVIVTYKENLQEIIPEAGFNTFCSTLDKMVCESIRGPERKAYRIKGSFLTETGRIQVTCVDKTTAVWVINAASTITWESSLETRYFKGWHSCQLPNIAKVTYKTFKVWVPGTKPNLAEFFDVLQGLNEGLNTSVWRCYETSNANKDGSSLNGLNFTLGIDTSSLELLQANKFSLFYGSNPIVFHEFTSRRGSISPHN